MKQIYITTIIAIFSLLNINFLNAQTVTVDNNAANEAGTYTFTYVTAGEIGEGTITPNVFYCSFPTAYPDLSPTVSDPNLCDPYVTFKINGTTHPCSTSFGTVGGIWTGGVQLSIGGAGGTGITVPAGATIEVTVSGVITNPPSSGNYTFNWKTSEGSGAATETFSDIVSISPPLSVDDLDIDDKKVRLFPNPSSDFLKVSGLTKAENYKIFNILGAQVNEGIISNGEKIQIENLTNGLYFLKFNDGNTIKFLKK